jgi:hypothetical protein
MEISFVNDRSARKHDSGFPAGIDWARSYKAASAAYVLASLSQTALRLL